MPLMNQLQQAFVGDEASGMGGGYGGPPGGFPPGGMGMVGGMDMPAGY